MGHGGRCTTGGKLGATRWFVRVSSDGEAEWHAGDSRSIFGSMQGDMMRGAWQQVFSNVQGRFLCTL
jgi:hypothetical protein